VGAVGQLPLSGQVQELHHELAVVPGMKVAAVNRQRAAAAMTATAASAAPVGHLAGLVRTMKSSVLQHSVPAHQARSWQELFGFPFLFTLLP
jgi:hypothetical protein